MPAPTVNTLPKQIVGATISRPFYIWKNTGFVGRAMRIPHDI